MVENTNSLEKSPSKSFRYLEKQEENGSSKKMVCPEMPILKEKEHIARDVKEEQV
ncbi:14353_t:CDS:2 [Gigaspora rosea]|nr:14353_t:CDS:2 [Gigaspora rosea]